jgi:hypothetical protein
MQEEECVYREGKDGKGLVKTHKNTRDNNKERERKRASLVTQLKLLRGQTVAK